MLSNKDKFFYTLQFLDRYGGLLPSHYREDFGYREGFKFPDTGELEPEGILDHGYVIDRFGQEIIDDEGTVVVDVGCHSGIRFTSEFARLKPRANIIGVEISFDPSNFNNDLMLGERIFRSKQEVMNYLAELHRDLYNMKLEEACFDSRYPINNKYNSGQRVLTGFRIPGIVGSDLIEKGIEADVDLLLSTPINLAELKDENGNYLDDKNPRMRRFGYNFPISEYAKNFPINIRLLHRIMKAPVKRRKYGGNFVPETPRDEHNERLSILAKQLICLDRILRLEEVGMKTELWRYTDNDHGPYAPSHLIVARKA